MPVDNKGMEFIVLVIGLFFVIAAFFLWLLRLDEKHIDIKRITCIFNMIGFFLFMLLDDMSHRYWWVALDVFVFMSNTYFLRETFNADLPK